MILLGSGRALRTRSTLRRGSSNNTAIPAAEFLINFSKAGFL